MSRGRAVGVPCRLRAPAHVGRLASHTKTSEDGCVKRWGPFLGVLVGGAIGFAIGWHFAEADINKAGDWRNGAARFIGMTSAIGMLVGYIVMMRVTRGVHVTRDGFTVTYKPAEAVPQGYRELKTLTVGDLVERLKAVGYQPALEACD